MSEPRVGLIVAGVLLVIVFVGILIEGARSFGAILFMGDLPHD